MESISVYKRKTGKLIAKNIIILLVLLAVAVLSIWAWFTKGTSATADGIGVKAKADGIEVSWDGDDYYDHLTALSQNDVVPGETGLALNISGKTGEPAPLKLITGNGLKFFEPYLNRRLGQVVYNSDGSWQGYDIADTNSAGKYIDIPLYFRSTTARDIYLAGDSKVSPKDTSKRISTYGAFSKDYIAGASRVAFLDSKKENCSFIWAPNADYELEENSDGYTRYTQTEIEKTVTSSGGTDNLENFGCPNTGKTYYFWTFADNKVIGNYPQNLNDFTARQFVYDTEKQYYTASVEMYIPTYGGDNPSIPFFINETSSLNMIDIDSYNQYVNGEKSRDEYEQLDKGQYFGVTNTNFNIGDEACSNAFDIANRKISTGSKISFKVAYNPVLKRLVILSYTSSDGGSFSRGEDSTEIETIITYYPLPDDVNCILVNPDSANAISADTHFKKSVLFRDNGTKLNVLPLSVTLAEQFIVEKTGDKHEATYKFKNVKTGNYLAVSNGTVLMNAGGSSFSLAYIQGFSGPALKCGEYYVVFKNGSLTAITSSELQNNNLVTVYTGSSYKMHTDRTVDNQIYQYYDSSSKSLVDLNTYSNPKLYTSTNSTSETTRIGDKIISLKKETEGADYYTGLIYMRIWVEGTDREAKTPLADGIFDTSFHFISK